MSNMKNLLERRASKNVLTQWRRYADDFDKYAPEEEEDEEDSHEFDYLDSEDEDENDFFVRKPKLETKQRESTSSRRRMSSAEKKPKTLRLRRNSLILLEKGKNLLGKRPESETPTKTSQYSMAPLGWNFAEDQLLAEECSVAKITCPIEATNQKGLTKPSSLPNKSNFSIPKLADLDVEGNPAQNRKKTSEFTKSSGSVRLKSDRSGSTKRSDKSSNPKNPRTALKFFPKEEVGSSTNSIPAMFGASNTLGRTFSQNQYMKHYREKFVSEELGRCRSELTIVTPMEEEGGSFILCEAKSATPDLAVPLSRGDKMYELIRSPAVVIGGDLSDVAELSHASYAAGTTVQVDSLSPTSSSEETDDEYSDEEDPLSYAYSKTGKPAPFSPSCDQAHSSSTPTGNIRYLPPSSSPTHLPTLPLAGITHHPPEETCSEPNCKYLEVCPSSHKRTSSTGSTHSSQSECCSDVCLPAASCHLTHPHNTGHSVVEFRSQDSIEEAQLTSSSSDGFTVSKIFVGEGKDGDLEYDYDNLIKVTEPSPVTDIDSPDFETYLEKIYEEKRAGEEKEEEQISMIESALSEESQAMMWSNINEVKRVITQGENPITWLINKTPVNSAIQSLFESTNESKNLLSNFFSSQRIAISDRAENETGPSSKWGGRQYSFFSIFLRIALTKFSNLNIS